ncbi:hypothetical protein [Rudaea sp.]|uniref:hypothetical protein n=1 Tax=Rudaea sp. TaxID=2136325 RepID=UPI002ED6279C
MYDHENPDDFGSDQLNKYERRFARPRSRFWDSERARPSRLTPVAIDRSVAKKIPVRIQEDRNTCVSFALTDAMQLLLWRERRKKIELSAGYAHWLFNRSEQKPWCKDDAFSLAKGTLLLHRYPVCTTDYCSNTLPDCLPQDSNSLNPSSEARKAAQYGIADFFFIDRRYVEKSDRLTPSLDGPDITNTNYLECILSQGHDIVLALDWPLTEIGKGPWSLRRNKLDGFPMWVPNACSTGHALVVVGYNRIGKKPVYGADKEPYFVCRNTAAASDKNGITYLTYDFVRAYALYGVVVLKVRYFLK